MIAFEATDGGSTEDGRFCAEEEQIERAKLARTDRVRRLALCCNTMTPSA